MKLLGLINSDIQKYKKYGSSLVVILFLTQGFWATFQYRIAHFIYTHFSNKQLRTLIMIPVYFWQKVIEILTGITIPAAVKIGHSFYIGHYGGVIINGTVVIGDNCNLSQGVTLGVSGVGDKRGTPIIGNNVYIGANATLVGKVTIGDNSLVAANSLVNKSFQANSVLIGVPAVLKSSRGSLGYI